MSLSLSLSLPSHPLSLNACSIANPREKEVLPICRFLFSTQKSAGPRRRTEHSDWSTEANLEFSLTVSENKEQ